MANSLKFTSDLGNLIYFKWRWAFTYDKSISKLLNFHRPLHSLNHSVYLLNAFRTIPKSSGDYLNFSNQNWNRSAFSLSPTMFPINPTNVLSLGRFCFSFTFPTALSLTALSILFSQQQSLKVSLFHKMLPGLHMSHVFHEAFSNPCSSLFS